MTVDHIGKYSIPGNLCLPLLEKLGDFMWSPCLCWPDAHRITHSYSPAKHCSGILFTVLRHQCQEQLQLWEAVPVACTQTDRWSKPRVCRHASSCSTRDWNGSSNGKQIWTGAAGTYRLCLIGSQTWHVIVIYCYALFLVFVINPLNIWELH